jgi:hypothetical protein
MRVCAAAKMLKEEMGEPMETTVIAYLACPGGAFRLRQKLVLQGKANGIPERR